MINLEKACEELELFIYQNDYTRENNFKAIKAFAEKIREDAIDECAYIAANASEIEIAEMIRELKTKKEDEK